VFTEYQYQIIFISKNDFWVCMYLNLIKKKNKQTLALYKKHIIYEYIASTYI